MRRADVPSGVERDLDNLALKVHGQGLLVSAADLAAHTLRLGVWGSAGQAESLDSLSGQDHQSKYQPRVRLMLLL